MKLTRSEYAELIRNRPHLAPDRAVERKQSQGVALVQSQQAQPRNSPHLEIRVTIILCLWRLRDSDSIVGGGTKAIRDAIATSLGIDDGDPRIKFEYGQVQTNSQPGVIVKMQALTQITMKKSQNNSL